jgi:hypothetical protein
VTAAALTFHALRLLSPPPDDGDFPLPSRPGARWLGGIAAQWDVEGRAHPDAGQLLWLGLWDDATAAVDAVACADDWLPHRAAAAAHWSPALQPYIRRGEVN